MLEFAIGVVSGRCRPCSAYPIFSLFDFFFSAGTVFFSHNNSVGTVFSAKFQTSERGAVVNHLLPASAKGLIIHWHSVLPHKDYFVNELVGRTSHVISSSLPGHRAMEIKSLPCSCPTELVTFSATANRWWMHCSNIPKTSNPSHTHQLANEAKTTHPSTPRIPAVIELSSISW